MNLDSFGQSLNNRCNSLCELCGSDAGNSVFEVPPAATPDADKCVMICETCRSQIERDGPLDVNHWHCLQQSAWSEVAAVQVLAYRILSRLPGEPSAQDLLEQMYLDEETLAWAVAGIPVSEADDVEPTVDSNGTRLANGDTVQIIKDLDVKGGGFVAKRGTTVKNIRLTSNPEHIDGRVNGTAIVLKTCFLKKMN